MVATISTRGSSEGLLGVLTMGLVWAVERRKITLAALVLGLGVHFKLYPFIWAPAIIWWMDDEHMGTTTSKNDSNQPTLVQRAVKFCSPERIKLAAVSFTVFMGLNILMYTMYDSLTSPSPFLQRSSTKH